VLAPDAGDEFPFGLANPDEVGLAGNGCGNAATGDSRGCPNLAFLALQSATVSGSTFGNGLRAVSG
jgi:hypothetical protein